MQPLTPDQLASLLIRRYVLTHSLGWPGPTAHLLLLVAAALAGLLLLFIMLQGPRSFLPQLLDLPAHLRQFRRGATLLSTNYRPLVVLLAASVISWSLTDLTAWNDPAEAAVQDALLSGKSPLPLAVQHALLVALQPERDMTALSIYLPLLLALCLRLLSGETLDRALLAAGVQPAAGRYRSRITVVWLAMLLLTAHRLFAWLPGVSVPPLATCLVIDSFYLPLLTALADAVLLAWVLAELRRARLTRPNWEPDDIHWFLRSWPVLAVLCFLTQPARYLALFFHLNQLPNRLLLLPNPPPLPASPPSPAALPAAPSSTPAPLFNPSQVLLWLIVAQFLALIFWAAPAVVPTTRPSLRSAFAAYFRLLKTSAGRIYGMLILGGALAGSATALSYIIFFLMPPTPWRLLAAETYSHYATLILGLILLAALFDLAADQLGIQPATAAEAEIPSDRTPVVPPTTAP